MQKFEETAFRELIFVCCFGPTAEGVLGLRVPIDRGIVWAVYRTGGSQVTSDAYESPQFDRECDRRTGYRTRSVLCVAIRIGNSVCGVIELMNKSDGTEYRESERELLEIFAQYISYTIQNALDAEIVARKAADTALSTSLTQLTNTVTTLQTSLNTEIAARQNLKVSDTGTFRKVRDFIFELRPMMLDDLGLVPTLKRYVDAWKDQAGIEGRLMVTGKERRLGPYGEVMIFRAVQELLNNAAQYSGSTSVKVLDMGDTIIKVAVDDDGKGCDADRIAEKRGMGLKVIRDRVEMLGGLMIVDSVVGQGTRVTFQLPTLEPQLS